MARPSSGRWANVGGNVAEPSSGVKDTGCPDGSRFPAKFFNWILNNIYAWITQIIAEIDVIVGYDLDNRVDTLEGYDLDNRVAIIADTVNIGHDGRLDTLEAQVSSGSFNVKVTTTDIDVESTGTIYWRKSNGIVTLTLPTALSGASVSAELRIRPVTTFPSAILPSVVTRCSVSQVKWHTGSITTISGGFVIIPTTTSGYFEVFISSGSFFLSSGAKGLEPTVMTYGAANL